MSMFNRIVDLRSLEFAWEKVKANKPAAGADEVKWDSFDIVAETELKLLHEELVNNTYEVFPVKNVKIRQGDKLREISLFTMRDKVVQTSIATELNKVIEPTLSENTFAYRVNRSALEALSIIETLILDKRYFYVCKTDVKNFFDNIDHGLLRNLLLDELKEMDVVELIMAQLQTEILQDGGNLTTKQIGIYQGASISPVLSNLFLRNVDKTMTTDSFFYGRYADDIIILCTSLEEAENALTSLSGQLNRLHLSTNTEKTYIRKISEGFDFLGYHFDEEGKSIPAKAEIQLEQSLEDVWISMFGASLEERLVKGSQILNGWEQYFREERPIGSIYEYAVVVYMMRNKEDLFWITKKREDFKNNSKDICVFLSAVWKENGWMDYVIFEYEQFYGISTDVIQYEENEFRDEIIKTYERLLCDESEDNWDCLLQSYADMGMYDLAERVSEYIENSKDKFNSEKFNSNLTRKTEEINYSNETMDAIHSIFFGREDMYSREFLDINLKRKSEMVAQTLNNAVLKKHLDGEITIGTYLVRSNDSVKYAVLDVDIIKKALIENPNGLEGLLKEAGEFAAKIKNILSKMGIKSYIEFSGYIGFHIWIFFSEWIAIRYVFTLLEMIKRKVGEYDMSVFSLETFPIQNRKRSGHSAQNIKLPFGIHLSTGNRSYFLDDEFEPIGDVDEFLKGIARYSSENVKRVIGAYVSGEDMKLPRKSKEAVELNYEELGHISDSVGDVLRGCNLMKYLVNKSMSTGYLTHFERLSILNVFGHLGEDGKEFVHKVMSYTINYQYNVTQGFINRIMEKPVSCVKLREQYKLVSSEYGCNCAFKRTKNCYPSPVIHALKDNNEHNKEITVPVSRTLTKEKKEKIVEELNSSNKIEELAGQLMQLNKQKRELLKAIRKVEKELNILFDGMNTDIAEIEIGILMRKKKEDGSYDWVIDI